MGGRFLPGVAAAVLVVALAFHSGGYFASDWGLVALALVLAAITALLLADGLHFGRLDALLLAALGALGAWQLLTIVWSTGAGVPVLEAERTLVYLCGAAALLLCLTPARAPSLLAGVVVGVTVVAVYALGTRLLPGTMGGAYDPSSGYQLAKPIGYWNALGLLLAMGIALAAGLALRGPRHRAVIAAAALIPLTTALYFTFSRGSVAALAVALVALVALEVERLRAGAVVATLFAAPAVAVLLASRSPALTAPGATLQTAQAQGHRLAWQLGVLVLAAATVAMLVGLVERRVHLSRGVRRTIGFAACIAVAAGLVGGLVLSGGPVAVVDRVRDAFVAQPPPTERGLERRLLSVSGNGRADYWRVAARMVERNPLRGAGAGAFTARWARERPVEVEARDAHNLYLETLAELGPIGLAVLIVALGAPLIALRRVRTTPPATAAAAAYAAFLVHAAVDWDWEVPLLVLVALGCAASLLVLTPGRAAFLLTFRRRALGLAVGAAVIAAALVVHVGNRATASALDALARDEPAAAEVAARRARAWMPWSHEPWQLLGESQLSREEDAAAASSLRRAARRDPGQWSVWYDLALAARGPERVAALTRARDLNPLSVEISDLAADIRTDP